MEHRFGHIRANQGCGRNPNKQAAYEAGQKADAVRNAQQSRRRNSDRGVDSFRVHCDGPAAKATMPVNAKERRDMMRAEGKERGEFVFEARSLRRR